MRTAQCLHQCQQDAGDDASGNFSEEGKFARQLCQEVNLPRMATLPRKESLPKAAIFAQEGNVVEEGGIFAKDGNVIKEGKFANEGFVVNICCHHRSHVDECALAHNGYALALAHEGLFQLLSLLPLRNAMAGNFSLCACT
jgi:hypothetical protein